MAMNLGGLSSPTPSGTATVPAFVIGPSGLGFYNATTTFADGQTGVVLGIGNVGTQGTNLHSVGPVTFNSRGTLVFGTPNEHEQPGEALNINSVADSNGAGMIGITVNQWNNANGAAEPWMLFKKLRGTVASPTILQAGDTVGLIQGQGEDGARTANVVVGNIELAVALGVTPAADKLPGAWSIKVADNGTAVPASANSVATSQTPGGAGNLTLTASPVTFTGAASPKVTLTSVGNLSGLTFTINGLNFTGASVSENLTGPNNSTVASVTRWSSVTSISVNGAAVAAVSAGNTVVSVVDTATLINYDKSLTQYGTIESRVATALGGGLLQASTTSTGGRPAIRILNGITTGTNNTAVGDFEFRMASSTGAIRVYSSLFTQSRSASNGSESGQLQLRVSQAGAATAYLTLDGNDLTITAGAALISKASATSAAGFNIPPGAAPTSPNNGDMWTTAAGAFIRINGVTKTFTLT